MKTFRGNLSGLILLVTIGLVLFAVVTASANGSTGSKIGFQNIREFFDCYGHLTETAIPVKTTIQVNTDEGFVILPQETLHLNGVGGFKLNTNEIVYVKFTDVTSTVTEKKYRCTNRVTFIGFIPDKDSLDLADIQEILNSIARNEIHCPKNWDCTKEIAVKVILGGEYYDLGTLTGK